MRNVKQKRHTHDDPHRDEDNLKCENNKRMLKTSQTNVKCKTKPKKTPNSSPERATLKMLPYLLKEDQNILR